MNESDKFTSWYDWKDQAKSSGYTITKKDDKIVALNKQGQVVGHWSDVGKFLSGKAPRPNFKRPEEQDMAEGLDPEKKQRLKDLIDQYRDATDPEYMGDDDYEDIIAQIRAEFGDRTADSVEQGPSMHYPRPGHSMVYDPMQYKSSPRITKSGILNKQDVGLMKRDIKQRLKQGVAEGIYDSSKDYGTNEVTIIFDGDIPSKEEIIQYCKKNYGFIPSSIDIDPPNNFRGMINPGTIKVKQGVAEDNLSEHDQQDSYDPRGEGEIHQSYKVDVDPSARSYMIRKLHAAHGWGTAELHLLSNEELVDEFKKLPNTKELFGKLGIKEQGLAEAKADPLGPWIAHKNGTEAKQFKTREGAKKYVASHEGFTINSSERFHDTYRKKKDIAENSIDESEISENDLILKPGISKRLKPGFVSKADNRIDREVEMALVDLKQANKNSKSIYQMLKDVPEEEGIAGWVQEKIIKASDYLKDVKEYLEGPEVSSEGIAGAIAGGVAGVALTKSPSGMMAGISLGDKVQDAFESSSTKRLFTALKSKELNKNFAQVRQDYENRKKEQKQQGGDNANKSITGR